jgi:hypothetical protein
MMQQQAPMVTQVQAPDGGFYFVMTSPTGQAMLLQPVASQQMPMYGGQFQGIVPNQPVQGQASQAQFIPQQNAQFAPQMGQSPQMGFSQTQVYQGSVSQFVSSNSSNQQQFQQAQQFFPTPMQQSQPPSQSQQQFYHPQMPSQQFSAYGGQSTDPSQGMRIPDTSSQGNNH